MLRFEISFLFNGIAGAIFFLGLLAPGNLAAESKDNDKEKRRLWKKEAALGYSNLRGNTRSSTVTADLRADWKNEKKEFNLRTNTYYSSSNHSMDGQKWYVMARYGIVIWGKKNFNYYKLESDHDKFADIDYRIIPSAGLGYWFFDTEDWKAMAEIGWGFTHTNYISSVKSSNEATLVPRGFFEKALIGESRLIEDVTVYPSLKNKGHYRLHSETSLSNPINKRLLLRISLIDNYNSHPAPERKKNDIQLISSISYSF